MNVICECGAKVEIAVDDKRGFVCDVCGGLFDVDAIGTVSKSPLREVRVVETGVKYEIDPPGRVVTNNKTPTHPLFTEPGRHNGVPAETAQALRDAASGIFGSAIAGMLKTPNAGGNAT